MPRQVRGAFHQAFFTDNCYKLLKSLHLIGWEQICQWKTLTKRLMKCPPVFYIFDCFVPHISLIFSRSKLFLQSQWIQLRQSWLYIVLNGETIALVMINFRWRNSPFDEIYSEMKLTQKKKSLQWNSHQTISRWGNLQCDDIHTEEIFTIIKFRKGFQIHPKELVTVTKFTREFHIHSGNSQCDNIHIEEIFPVIKFTIKFHWGNLHWRILRFNDSRCIPTHYFFIIARVHTGRKKRDLNRDYFLRVSPHRQKNRDPNCTGSSELCMCIVCKQTTHADSGAPALHDGI